MLHCDLRVRWKVASDLRFRAAISEPKTPSFCGISGDLAPSTRKSLAIAIVRFWCTKFCCQICLVLPFLVFWGNFPFFSLFRGIPCFLGRAIHGPIPVQGETLEELSGPLVHMNFPRKFVRTNGAQSSLKVSVLTGIGP